MLFDQRYEILRLVAGESRLCKMFVLRKEIFSCNMEIRKITSASAGDQNHDVFHDAFTGAHGRTKMAGL